jgi:hypothetical protein
MNYAKFHLFFQEKEHNMQMQSENIIDITAALIKLQSKLDFAAKDSINPHFKSKYADLSSVWAACKQLLTDNNLAVVQQLDIMESKNVLITTLIHSSGQWFKSIAPLNPVKNDPQGYGAAITYMRRYSLCAILGVIQDDDDGERACDNKNTLTKGKKAPVEIDPKKMKEMFVKYALSFDPPDEDLIIQYLTKYTNHWKKTPEETLEIYANHQTFWADFSKWKEKQVKQ